MLRPVVLFLVLVACGVLVRAQSKARPRPHKSADCYATAQVQLALNECAGGESQKAEMELDALYKRLLAKTLNPAYREKVEAAQKAWLAYRDAALEAKYPAADKRGQYGSVYSMCFANDRAELARQRTRDIRALLHEEEGDVCAAEWTQPKTK